MEVWDAYDKNGQKTGQTLVRGKDIPDGLYHLVVEALVVHEDGNFLMMQRHPDKPSYPLYFEASAGGSALSGETGLEAILREVREETRLSIDSAQLIHSHRADDDHCLFDCFVLTTAASKDSVQLQENETIAYQWVAPDSLESFAENHQIVPRQLRLARQYLSSKSNSSATKDEAIN